MGRNPRTGSPTAAASRKELTGGAGTSINAGLIDLVSIMGQSTWVDSIDELATLLPKPAGWKLAVTRWMKIQM